MVRIQNVFPRFFPNINLKNEKLNYDGNFQSKNSRKRSKTIEKQPLLFQNDCPVRPNFFTGDTIKGNSIHYTYQAFAKWHIINCIIEFSYCFHVLFVYQCKFLGLLHFFSPFSFHYCWILKLLFRSAFSYRCSRKINFAYGTQ